MTNELNWTGLRRELSGTLALPGEPGYNSATPWNLAVQMQPAAVVGAADTADVVATVRWAGEHAMQVVPQATGHSAMPFGDKTIVVLTRALDEVDLDAAADIARIGAGVTWGQVIERVACEGFLPVCGSGASVGVVGYLTGGGVGPLARSCGISSDYVRSFEVVTGDGTVRRASAQENPDLFWGLRGGKGTLGIVTEVVLELLRSPTFFGGNLYFAGADIEPVLRAWEPWAQALPAQATSSVCLMQLPPIPGVPEPIAGRMTLSVRLAWMGEDIDRSVADRIRAGRQPVFGEFDVLPAALIGLVHQDPTDPHPFTTGGRLLDSFPPDAVDALLHVAGPKSGSPLLAAEIRQLGGMAARRPSEPDAFCGRDAGFHLMTGGVPVPSSEAIDQAATRVEAALEPWASQRSLVNFVVRDDLVALRRFYDEPTLTRLSSLAELYDPKEVFTTGQVAPRPE